MWDTNYYSISTLKVWNNFQWLGMPDFYGSWRKMKNVFGIKFWMVDAEIKGLQDDTSPQKTVPYPD